VRALGGRKGGDLQEAGNRRSGNHGGSRRGVEGYSSNKKSAGCIEGALLGGALRMTIVISLLLRDTKATSEGGRRGFPYSKGMTW